MKPLQVVIIGAGGLAREVTQYAEDTLSEEYEIAGYLDDNPHAANEDGIRLRYPHLGPISDYAFGSNDRFLLTVGAPPTRARLAVLLQERGAKFVTLIHPRAYVAGSALIGYGSIVAPFATVGAGATIGEFSHLHFYSSAAHDTRVGSFVSLSPYAVANGQVHLGDQVFLGTHATVNPTKKVGAGARVTAGSVVYQDVPEGALASGNPAKARQVGQFGGW